MRVVGLLLLSLAVSDAFWMNTLANQVAALIKKLELPAVNKIIDDAVKEQLAANALIKRPPLVARKTANGAQTYRILQVPDLHYTNWDYFPCMNKPDDMKQMVDDTKPDFVAFTGDQIESLWVQKSLAAIDTATAVVNARGLPWAMVFGNHDESLIPHLFSNRKVMMAYIESLPHSYSKYGPFDIGGAGNYEVSIQDASAAAAMRLYFVDTNRDGSVTPAQIKHVKDLGASHKRDNVPALSFFHIPLPEYKDFKPTNETQAPSAKTWHPTTATTVSMTRLWRVWFFYRLQQWSKHYSLDGDVKATFCGHNHMNDFCFKRGSIHLCYGGGVGYGAAYNKGNHPRTGRVIEWNRNATDESIETWLYLHNKDNTRASKYSVYHRTLQQ
ncbi:hypothetical protein SPRG_13955 [Saprolegnia parasitica CBS 223.65]|uniref:Calcineurin-like phosphoesterase domain-containing protein n=1 Tax=Saprolegnia parasitica (strain CBS 223.65) TaxID=695850 RepID=A0A067C2I9_SAPPC|nr:hypothetical protein SPRG_13955 [Saprolegnia parasitica CBS 223.65]KDO21027.1 hypothetical protein SPRG_13955 [Saprolegnia parasitica CBS 223.65]|eukprot:XP_012208279.1 hypothetical protein SPRG_13955 [Saprolegnia parasitica CBS 223.65]